METKRKKCKVVMLPVKDQIKEKPTIFKSATIDALHLQIGDYKVENPHWIGQHLYILSDEKIEIGDWYYYSTVGSSLHKETGIYQSTTGKEQEDGFCKRIIATTAKLVRGIEGIQFFIPHPSKGFVSKYCKLGNIDKVDVEYIVEREPFNTEYLYIKGNEVVLHSVKNSWTKEEIEDILMRCNKDLRLLSREDIKDWLNQNL